MYNTKHLHVALSSDDNYSNLVRTLLGSLFTNNKSFDFISIHLLAQKISSERISTLKSVIPSGRGELIVYSMDNIQELLGVKVPNTISISSYSRLFLSSLLPQTIDKVIYMDVDALVIGDFGKLWAADIDNYEIAGVLDDVSLFAKHAINLPDNAPYVNAGFLLINLNRWRKLGMENKILNYLVTHNGKVFHHDQGLINKMCEQKLILPMNYNMVTNFYIFPYSNFTQQPFYSEEEFKKGLTDPIFIHFTAGVANRPWMKNCRHPLKDLYRQYMKEAGVDDYLQNDSRPFKLKALSFLYFNFRPLYALVIKLRSKFVER